MNRFPSLRAGMLCAATALAAPLAPGFCLAAPASNAVAGALAGNVAPFVARAPRVGTAPDGLRVDIVLHLALRDRDSLRGLVHDVSTPGTATYGRYLTPAAFAARFAPEAAATADAVAFLRGAGMSDVTADDAGTSVSASATVAQLRAAFGVDQSTYRVGGRLLRANSVAPRLPASLSGRVLAIEGLDDSTFLKAPQFVSAVQGDRVAPASVSPAAQSGTSPAATPPPVAAGAPSPYCSTSYGDTKATLSTKPNPYGQTLPWLVCGYTPQQIQQAYGMDPARTAGSGVTVAILDAYASPTLRADGNRYAANHNLPSLEQNGYSEIIPPGITNVSPSESCGPYGWWGEQSLDLAAVHGTAPGATIVYIGARNCGTPLTLALKHAIFNHTADIMTNSYSYNSDNIPAAQVAANDQTFMAAAAMGISLLFSSGDDGDLNQVNGVASGSFQSTSPYVTAVGGTTLAVYADGTRNEWGWGTYRDYLANATVNSASSITTTGLVTQVVNGQTQGAFAFYSGAGGGISFSEPQPDYQIGKVPTALATTIHYYDGSSAVSPTAQRVVPDLSMLADPYTGYLYGETFTIAGNSAADHGCTATSATTEYCEASIGGTSLASPLLAGVFARANAYRKQHGVLGPLGFANPSLYARRIGQSFGSAGIIDVNKPESALALLRGYQTDLTRVRLITINSVPLFTETTPATLAVCTHYLCSGINDVFNFTDRRYDDVTGLGVPYVRKFIQE